MPARPSRFPLRAALTALVMLASRVVLVSLASCASLAVTSTLLVLACVFAPSCRSAAPDLDAARPAPPRVELPELFLPSPPDPAGLPRLEVAPRRRVELSTLVFHRADEPSRLAELEGEGDARAVVLPVDAQGQRWVAVFETTAPGTSRLFLDWTAGPDGFLFEVVLDGERLLPPRDGFRPSERRLLSDLGPRWLGRGTHRLEFVAREETSGVLRLHALVLTAPD